MNEWTIERGIFTEYKNASIRTEILNRAYEQKTTKWCNVILGCSPVLLLLVPFKSGRNQTQWIRCNQITFKYTFQTDICSGSWFFSFLFVRWPLTNSQIGRFQNVCFGCCLSLHTHTLFTQICPTFLYFFLLLYLFNVKKVWAIFGFSFKKFANFSFSWKLLLTWKWWVRISKFALQLSRTTSVVRVRHKTLHTTTTSSQLFSKQKHNPFHLCAALQCNMLSAIVWIFDFLFAWGSNPWK